jgi:hypothetical protein
MNDELSDYLDDQTRAEQWRKLRMTLVARRKELRLARETADTEDLNRLDSKIAALTEQISALRVEEAVAKFIEDSVRFSVVLSEGTDAEQPE